MECECRVNSLSWDPEGFRLLMGGTYLQMWKLVKKFSIEPGDEPSPPKLQWECIWKCKTATEVHFLSFSPDACLFATAGKFDRIVKIWYPVTSKYFLWGVGYRAYISYDLSDAVNVIFQIGFSPNPDKISYDFIYLAHPRAVTGFSWRQTSKYMPK